MANMDSNCCKSLWNAKSFTPTPPPLPSSATGYSCKFLHTINSASRGLSCVSSATKNLWERLFDEGYKADVCINTENGGIVYAHSTILVQHGIDKPPVRVIYAEHVTALRSYELIIKIGARYIKLRVSGILWFYDPHQHGMLIFCQALASPVIRGMLKQAKCGNRWRSISITGVPHGAVRAFIRFLYSSCYEKEEMEEFILPLLVLSHVFAVPHLKRECEQKLELGLLTIDNVVDAFQLALLCDAPRLSLICHRMMLKNFKAVSESEGWKAMKQSHPVLEKEVVVSMVEEENRKKERVRKISERKTYLQLYEAMEALVHICRDGCRTIGPHDKDFKANQPCRYGACKGLELLVRHFAGCKPRVPGGCVHCKRMWQLLELHSRLCADPDYCRVPLCRNFKQRISKQSKKDEIRWKILVEKILRTRGIGIAPCFRPQ